MSEIGITALPESIAIIDTKFQQTYRPKGRFAEQKVYYSKKHGAYGIKTEVTHARNGRAMFYSAHVPGSIHDYNLFSQSDRLEKLRAFLLKSTSDKRLEDTGELSEKYRLFWAVLMDKAYVGAEERVRAIIPKKAPQNQAENNRNERVGRERVMCENYYGRMCALWGIISKKYRWDHQLYDKIFGICLALTNANVDISPLRGDEYLAYRALLQEYEDTAREQLEREKRNKEISRQRCSERNQRLRNV